MNDEQGNSSQRGLFSIWIIIIVLKLFVLFFKWYFGWVFFLNFAYSLVVLRSLISGYLFF